MHRCFFWITASVLMMICCSPRKKDSLEGAWALIQAEYPAPEDSSKQTHSGKTVKLITHSFFICLNQGADRKDTVISCGKYAFDGKHYTETMESFTHPQSTGQSFSYRSKIKGSRWELKGIRKTNTDSSGSDFHSNEIWERIE